MSTYASEAIQFGFLAAAAPNVPLRERMDASSMMKTLVSASCGLILLVAPGDLGQAAKNADQSHYVNGANPRADDSGPGTSQQPWKSLSAVNSHTFNPGDSVYFAKGSAYTGGLVIKDSGTASRPITLTAYGNGPAPSFTNPDFSVLNGNVIQIKGSYIVVDALHFHDGAAAPSGKSGSVFRMGDVFIDKGGDHNIIRNSQVVNSPIGFNVHGEYCVITRNDLRDCTRFLKPPGWGPIAIFIGNANTEISYNRIRNYLASGGAYGADGGALEVDPRLYNVEAHDINIHHNYSYGNEGFLEITKATERINVSYNVSNDYQQFVFYWEGTNSVIENNTVLRVLPKNSVTDVVFSFKDPGNIVRNNIFVVGAKRQVFSDNGTQVYKKGDYAGQKRHNNIYFSADGTQQDPCGLPLGEGDKIADPGFVDYAKQDYHLKPGSPAVDAGFSSGSATDLDGRRVPMLKGRDIGAFEFGAK